MSLKEEFRLKFGADLWRTVAIGAITLIVLYFTVAPLALLLVSSLKQGGLPGDRGLTLEHYVTTYTDPRTYTLLGSSLLFAAGTAVFALCLGLVLAWLLERTDMPARGFWRLLVLVPMATPPLILAMSWILLLSPRIGAINHLLMFVFGLEQAPFNIFSFPGMIFVQGLALVPVAFLTIAPAFRNMDPALEEAAATAGASLWGTLRRVVLPLLAPSLGAAAAFLFIVGLVVFDIPGILGLPVRIMVFSSKVFMAANPAAGLPEYGQASSLALVFLVILGLLSWVYFRLIRQSHRFVTVTGKGFRPRLLRLGRWRYLALALVLLYFVLAVAAPLGILVWTSLLPYYTKVSAKMLPLLSLKNYWQLFAHPKVLLALRNTAIVVVAAASGVAVLSGLVSWVIVRIGGGLGALLDVLSFLPVAIPNILLGLALVYVYLTVKFIPIYGTVWILVVAYITQYLSFGTRATNGAYLQIQKDLEEAAQVAGASWGQTMRRIVVPLVAPALAGVWIWVAGHAMRELSAALMLTGGKNVVLSTLLWGFWESGEMTRAAALAVLFTLALTVLVMVSGLVSRRSESARWL